MEHGEFSIKLCNLRSVNPDCGQPCYRPDIHVHDTNGPNPEFHKGDVVINFVLCMNGNELEERCIKCSLLALHGVGGG